MVLIASTKEEENITIWEDTSIITNMSLMCYLLLTLKILKLWFPVFSIKGRTLWNWLQSKHDDIEKEKSEYQIAFGILQ